MSLRVERGARASAPARGIAARESTSRARGSAKRRRPDAIRRFASADKMRVMAEGSERRSAPRARTVEGLLEVHLGGSDREGRREGDEKRRDASHRCRRGEGRDECALRKPSKVGVCRSRRCRPTSGQKCHLAKKHPRVRPRGLGQNSGARRRHKSRARERSVVARVTRVRTRPSSFAPPTRLASPALTLARAPPVASIAPTRVLKRWRLPTSPSSP